MKDEYKKLRELLSQNQTWPLLYMFKFIVPNKEEKVEKVLSLLPKSGKLSFNHTKNLRHVAITCKVRMAGSDEIVSIIRKVSAIEGVLSL